MSETRVPSTIKDVVSPDRRSRRSPVDDRGPEPMAAEHRAAVADGRDQVRRGEIASEDEVEAVFRSFGP